MYYTHHGESMILSGEIITKNVRSDCFIVQYRKYFYLHCFVIYFYFVIFQSLVEYLIDWADVMNKMLRRCDQLVAKRKSSRSHWHPIFGWYSEPLDRRCFKTVFLCFVEFPSLYDSVWLWEFDEQLYNQKIFNFRRFNK